MGLLGSEVLPPRADDDPPTEPAPPGGPGWPGSGAMPEAPLPNPTV